MRNNAGIGGETAIGIGNDDRIGSSNKVEITLRGVAIALIKSIRWGPTPDIHIDVPGILTITYHVLNGGNER